jgi:integrase
MRSPHCSSSEWRDKRAATKRSRKDDESIGRQLDAHFGRLLLIEVGTTQIDAYRVALEARVSRKTVHNHLTVLKAMLNAAKQWGWLVTLPHIAMPTIKRHGRNFRYLRTRGEIQRFLQAASDEGPLVFTMFAVAVYAGLRAGELAGLEWDDVDFERRLIMVQRSYDGPTKSGEPRPVPILDALLPILRRWRLQNPLPILFPNERGRKHSPAARVFQEVLHRVLDRAGFPKSERNGRILRYITFHCLRHYADLRVMPMRRAMRGACRGAGGAEVFRDAA